MSDFMGCGLKFPPEADAVTGKLKTVSREEDIAEAVRIILFTGRGERVMQPEFGCDIRKYAFADINTTTLNSMEQDILEALIRFEPRICKPQVTIGKERMREGVLEIKVSYLVRTTNNPYNLVFPYYINEGINL